MKNIVLFASGAGSNAENIIKYFQKNEQISVGHLFCNNANAAVLSKARNLNVDVTVFEKGEMVSMILGRLKNFDPDLIVLAGFLLKFPPEIISSFPSKIINIHPALLPKYGGKGMYGAYVHQSVFDNKERETGITIHYVNENYDEGNIIFQKTVEISKCTSAEEIAAKVHELELIYFPQVINQLL